MSIVKHDSNNRLVRARRFIDPAITTSICLLALLFIGSGHNRVPFPRQITNHTGTGNAPAHTGGSTGAAGSHSTGGSSGTGGVHTGGTTGTGGTGTGGVAGTTGTGGTGTGGTGTGGIATGGAAGSGTGGATGGSSGNCGNGTIEAGEFCDGSQLQGATCVSLGFSGGSLSCSSSCQFDVSSCSGGTITPTVLATSTSCTTPCGVFFDTVTTTGLSGSDYVGANWNWDFNDPTSLHKGSVGSGVGHVYDSPGTYIATVRVKDISGAAGKATKTITVTAPSYTNFYVSASGNDSNNGLTMSTPWLTAAHGFATISSSQSLLFRRGDTFSLSGTPTVTGPVLITAYTDPGHISSSAPILNTGASGSIILTGTKTAMTNIHIVSTGSGNGIQLIGATNPVVEYNEIEGIGTGSGGSTNGLVFYGDTGATVDNFIFDNNTHDNTGYGYYGATDHLAIVGNQFIRVGGGDHGIRVIHGNLTYVAENTIVGNAGDPGETTPFSGITIRGDHTNIVLWRNLSNRIMEFTPQNTDVLEEIQFGLAEANIVNGDLSPPYSYAFGVTAKNIVVRNNIFAGSPVGISVFWMSPLPNTWITNIAIYNNTDYFFGTSYDPTFGSLFCSASSPGAGTLSVQNNIFAQGQTDTDSQVAFLDAFGASSMTITEDHNLGYGPNGIGGPWVPGTGAGDIVGNPHFLSTTLTDPYPLQIASTSAARNAGTSIPAYQDRAAVTRPKESVNDMGVSEYAP